MFTPVLFCSFCRKFCLVHEFAQIRNRWFNADAFETRYPLSIEQLARQETLCPDCSAQYDLLVTHGRRSE